MSDGSPAVRSYALTRALCVLIVVLMAAGMVYAGWIAVLNFPRIGV